IGAAIFGGKYLAVWAFGWVVQQWAAGVLAAAVGGMFGASLGALIGFLAGGDRPVLVSPPLAPNYPPQLTVQRSAERSAAADPGGIPSSRVCGSRSHVFLGHGWFS